MSVQQLREEATAIVEKELRVSAESTELEHEQFRELQVKCWTKFYGCCYEYQQLMSQIVGVFHEPATGLVCLFKEDMLSFLYPATPVDCLALQIPDNVPLTDTERVIEAAIITRDQLNYEALESLLFSEEPDLLAADMTEAIADIPPKDSVMYRHRLKTLLDRVSDVSHVLENIASSLDPTLRDGAMESNEDDLPESEFLLSLSKLFSSPLCERLVAGIIRDACLTRMTIARDIILLISILQYYKLGQNVKQSCICHFITLLQSYRCIYWLCCQPVIPTSPLSVENNLQQLAALDISTSQQSPYISECSVLELYVRGIGGNKMRAALLRTETLSGDMESVTTWNTLLTQSVTILISQLWPPTHCIALCQFLLSSCQYTHLQDYVAETECLECDGQGSVCFLLAQSYLATGEVDKAVTYFLRAVSGQVNQSETVIHEVMKSVRSGSTVDEGEDEEESAGEGEIEQKLRYYMKVMQLFEQASCPLAVIEIAEVAVRSFAKDDLSSAMLQSTLFKYYLELGHYDDAYMAMMSNPDPIRRKECLHHFVVILTEQNQLKLICRLNYPEMEEEIVRVIEDRARSVDLMKHKYYDLLYCFHTTKHNYRKAASVMYEYGLRLGREVPGPGSLQKQANCYCMCLTALHLAEPKYAWVVVPVELGEIMEKNTKKSQTRKRPRPSENSQVHIEVRTVFDIEKDYSLVKTKLSLLKREPTMATQICSPFVSPEEVVARLIQVGLFDKAVDTAICFELPLDPILESLASRCVHLSSNMMAFRDGVEDMSTWNWLGDNESINIPTPTERSVVDKAWLMLKSYLEIHDPSQNYKLQKCVATKLLSLGSHIPQWLIKTYKETNPAELLRLYLMYDHLVEASHLAIQYIDGVLGLRKDEFSLQTTLHASSPSVWLPYSSLEHLQVALQKAHTNSSLTELSSLLSAKLEEYFRITASVTADMEHHARQRTMTVY